MPDHAVSSWPWPGSSGPNTHRRTPEGAATRKPQRRRTAEQARAEAAYGQMDHALGRLPLCVYGPGYCFLAGRTGVPPRQRASSWGPGRMPMAAAPSVATRVAPMAATTLGVGGLNFQRSLLPWARPGGSWSHSLGGSQSIQSSLRRTTRPAPSE